jgi:3-deoxy-D-manno-octulosonic-acid transferase
LFLEGRAAVLVRYPEELGIKIQFLLDNPTLARQLGDKAKELVLKNQGAIARNMEVLRSIISSP